MEEYFNWYNISDCRESSDQVWWKLTKKGEFSVISFYRHIVGIEQDSTPMFPFSQIWKSTVPPRIAFFAWEVCRESILTLDKLKATGRVVVNGCFMCNWTVESCCHLLLRCPAVYELWCMIYSLLGLNWASTCSVIDEIWAWSGVGLNKNIVKLIPLTIFWVI